MPEPRLCLPSYSHCQWSTKRLNPNHCRNETDTQALIKGVNDCALKLYPDGYAA